MPDPVIRADSLDLTFQTADGPVHALRNVTLDVQPGEFVSFIGPSGCGKTTFLRGVAALETPTGGTLTVNGMAPDQARRARAYGYVFQAAGLYPWRTIGRNVTLPLEIMRYPRTERPRADGAGAAAGGARPVRQPLSLAALGRDAAARLDRPRAGLRRRDPADGRALRRVGRDRARPAQRGVAGALEADGQDDPVRDALDPRGRLPSAPRSW